MHGYKIGQHCYTPIYKCKSCYIDEMTNINISSLCDSCVIKVLLVYIYDKYVYIVYNHNGYYI